MAMLLGGFSHSAVGKERPTTTQKIGHIRQADFHGQAPLIPRDVLFGNPRRAQARLSHDGKWISFQAPVNGVLNIWVAPADDLSKAKAVTEEKVRPIPSHDWAYDNKHILYIQDKNGDENFHLYATNVVTGETKDLTPIEGVRAELQEASPKFPDEVLVGLNDRDKRYHDIWRINIATGEKKLVQQNPGIAGFVTDDDFRVRLAMNYTPHRRPGVASPGKGKTATPRKWKDFLEFGPEDAMTSGPAGFDKTGETLYLEDSRNRNTAGLFAMDLEIGPHQADRRRHTRPTSAACSSIRPKRTSRPSRSPTAAPNGKSSTRRSQPISSTSKSSRTASSSSPAARSTTSNGPWPTCTTTAR